MVDDRIWQRANDPPHHGCHLITLIKINKEKQCSPTENLSRYVPMVYKIEGELKLQLNSPFQGIA